MYYDHNTCMYYDHNAYMYYNHCQCSICDEFMWGEVGWGVRGAKTPGKQKGLGGSRPPNGKSYMPNKKVGVAQGGNLRGFPEKPGLGWALHQTPITLDPSQNAFKQSLI